MELKQTKRTKYQSTVTKADCSLSSFPSFPSVPILVCALNIFFGLALNSAAADDAPFLKNAGFDDNVQNWSLTVYGAKPAIDFDAKIVHGGKQALHISASDPSDTAISQDVRLKPGGCYRFSTWVRTRHLDARNSPVYGTLQVQRRGGN